MSKKLTIDELKALVGEALTHIIDLFNHLVKGKSAKNRKRASLLSYWIKDYIQYIRDEDSFDPKTLIRYKRGSILQVEFGYRIGKELGGRHFAVVLDNQNGVGSGLITVVPLTSLKSTYKPNRYTFVPHRGVYDLVCKKLTKEIKELQELQKKNDELITQSAADFADQKISIQEYRACIAAAKKENHRFKMSIDTLTRQLKLTEKLKPGTVIDVGQVVTVSKMRISNPKMKKDTLYGVRLERQDLDMLDAKIKELYIGPEKKS